MLTRVTQTKTPALCLGKVSKITFVNTNCRPPIRMNCLRRAPCGTVIVIAGRRRRGPYATSPPRSPRDLPPRPPPRTYPIGGMFQLAVDDDIALVLAEERHALAMTNLIVRNHERLARWEPWAEQPATLDST